MVKNKYFYAIRLVLSGFLTMMIPASSFCQEYLEDLRSNKILFDNEKTTLKTAADAIILPFFDDFCYDDAYPNQKLWADNYVFVNNDFAYNPISIGVATFDALDAEGKLYEGLGPGYQGVADYLTSHSIRLDSIFDAEPRKMTAADSVYLSFFYQPIKKIENDIMENKDDELCLEFYSSTDDSWNPVWSAKRFAIDTLNVEANKGRYFLEAKILITDSSYFNDDFRFRLYNKATLENDNHLGFQNNASRWNIDYVYLNYGRTMEDYYSDVCFVSAGQSFLKDYYAMPNKQFAASINAYELMIDSANMVVSNLDSQLHNVSYKYEVINDVTNKVVWSHSVGRGNINPYYNPANAEINGSKTFAYGVFPNVYPKSNADKSSFSIRHVIGDTDLDIYDNDTVEFKQIFDNYYAYDDGVAEYAYCLTQRNEVMMCQRYKLNVADTLQAVAMYFNAIYGENEPIHYDLCVWNDELSAPYSIILEQDIEVEYDSVNAAGYYTYKLDNPLYISEDNGFRNLVFYVGLIKARQTPLSMGFDVSRNSSNYTYINYDGTWMKSDKLGTVMIRPYLGKPLRGDVGIADVENDNVKIFPNPVNEGFVTIDMGSFSGNNIVMVYDGFGKLCYSTECGDNECRLDVSCCKSGVYMVKIFNEITGKSVVKKLVVIE